MNSTGEHYQSRASADDLQSAALDSVNAELTELADRVAEDRLALGEFAGKTQTPRRKQNTK